MIKKQPLLVMTVLLTITGTTKVFASEQVFTNPVNEEASVSVSFQKDSSFAVTLPKTISIDATGNAEYSVVVKGDIASDQIVTVAPVDADPIMDGINFWLEEQSNATEKKESVECTVTQEITSFDVKAVCAENGTTVIGRICVQDLSAGNWNGILRFDISCN